MYSVFCLGFDYRPSSNYSLMACGPLETSIAAIVSVSFYWARTAINTEVLTQEYTQAPLQWFVHVHTLYVDSIYTVSKCRKV